MRIGMMLRSLDERGGIRIYSENLVQELLRIDSENEYVLFYRSAAHLGRYRTHRNVTERLVRGANKAIWDQISVPFACWHEKVDLLFHPKFTVPLASPCKAIMVVHGADWFIPEQAKFYGKVDLAYIRTFMPLYFKRAASVISVSKLTSENFRRVLKLPSDKIRTVYFGPASHFRRIDDEPTREAVRCRYGLPQRFILTLSKPHSERRKNLAHILEAYSRYRDQAENPLSLVVAGLEGGIPGSDSGAPDNGHARDVVFGGWIDPADMPAVYSMADLFLYPSNLEAFPIPIVEAMTCGTPIVTSNVNGLEEIAGDAAILVDPTDVAEISGALQRLVNDPALQAALSARGLSRSRGFSWRRCAKEILEIIEQVGSQALSRS